MRSASLLAFAMVALPSVAGAETAPPEPARPESVLPEAVRSMLVEAIASGSDSDVDAIARIARKTNPDAAAEIDAMVNAHREAKSAEKEERIRNANAFNLWGGKGEFGLFRSTGTTSEFGVSASLNLVREGLRWKHILRANADYRRANGETSRERFLAAYEPRVQINLKTFTYGLAQYERDPFIGFDNRYTASAGVGYNLVDSDRMKLSVDTGPSYRHVKYTDDGLEDRAGLRSSLDFNFKLTPTLTIRQNTYAYVEKDSQTLSSLTALDAKILSRLSARFSYNTEYESETEITPESFDTLSKVTLVYDF